MLRLLRWKRVSTPPPLTPTSMQDGWWQPSSAATLLAPAQRRSMLESIWQRTSLSRAQFASLYYAPLERFAELVQQFPASEYHHHSYPGGMLDHGLEIVVYALKLRQARLLPIGAAPEDQAAQSDAWTAAIAYGALLHDLGKLAVDLEVERADGERWHPWHGRLTQGYRFKYRKDRAYRLHGAATGLLYSQVLHKDILDWLSEFPEVWSSLLYVLAGQYEHAGVLGEFVQQADRASAAHALGGDPLKAQTAPPHSLQRKLLGAMRYLIKGHIKINQPQASDGWLTQESLWLVSKTFCDKLRAYLLSQGIDSVPTNNTALFNVLQEHAFVQLNAEGKAIWKATVEGQNGWTQSFTFLKLAPSLIWEEIDGRPAPFSGAVYVDGIGPVDPDATLPYAPVAEQPANAAHTAINESAQPLATTATAIADALETAEAREPPAVLQPEDDSEGARFLEWLVNSTRQRRLKINAAQALVHTVAGTAYLVSPGIFQRFVQERPDPIGPQREDEKAGWASIQKSFERLRMHRKQENGLNIWTCEVKGPRRSRRVHGYLLLNGDALFDERPPDNPFLQLAGQNDAAEH